VTFTDPEVGGRADRGPGPRPRAVCADCDDGDPVLGAGVDVSIAHRLLRVSILGDGWFFGALLGIWVLGDLTTLSPLLRARQHHPAGVGDV